MNKLFFKIKNVFKMINGFFDINPHKHWKVFLYLFFIITFCLLILSFYLFFKIKNDQVYEPIKVESNKKIILKEKLLKEVVESFDKKAETYNTILNN